MCQTNLLRLRVELARLAPHQRVLEMRRQAAVNAVTDSLDGGTSPQTNGVGKVGLYSALLRVHLDKPKFLRGLVMLTRNIVALRTFQMLSRSQSRPRSASQLIMTVLPSPARAIRSTVSIDTASILLMTVSAGRYFRVPRRTSINSSMVTCKKKRQHCIVPFCIAHILANHHVTVVD